MADFSFLSPSPPIQPAQNITLQISPPKPTSNPTPLIILDDYSVVHALQDTSTEDYSELSGLPESSLTGVLFPHPNCSASGDSDSDMLYPPSSGVPSETSSAGVSESNLSSAIASEADLPSQSHLHPPMPKKQSGLHDFFQTLTEDEVEAVRAKRKRADSDEEADQVACRQKEEQKQEKKFAVRREGNHLAQQKYQKKLVAINIQAGVWDSGGKWIPVS